jgi:hypothetical protein
MGKGAKEDESSTGRVWAAVFHRVTARSRLARILKLMNRLFLFFSNFVSGRGYWISVYGGTTVPSSLYFTG